MQPEDAMQIWYLEGYLNNEETLRRLPINGFRFDIGRNSGVKLCLPSSDISRNHAEIKGRGNELV